MASKRRGNHGRRALACAARGQLLLRGCGPGDGRGRWTLDVHGREPRGPGILLLPPQRPGTQSVQIPRVPRGTPSHPHRPGNRVPGMQGSGGAYPTPQMVQGWKRNKGQFPLSLWSDPDIS